MMTEAEESRKRLGRRTILFVDEIHRFNKAQQDAFLPRVEAGDIVLIGATTENPSFEVNSALLSRSKVHVLKPLDPGDDRRDPAARARRSPIGASASWRFAADDEALIGDREVCERRRADRAEPARARGGDRRRRRARIDAALIADLAQNRALLYDKTGEEHYNLISALHKSMRNSDPDAAVYWLARMLEAGEDPLYVARRLVRFASEDIGNADPAGLAVASRPRRRCTSSACRRATPRWRRPRSTWRPRRRATRSTARISSAAEAAATRRGRAGAAAPAQRADQVDEGARLRKGLSLRARRGGGGSRRDGLPASGAPRPRASTSRSSAATR